MLRKPFVVLAAVLALHSGAADARGGHGGGHGTRSTSSHSHSTSTRSTAHHSRSTETRSYSLSTRSHRDQTRSGAASCIRALASVPVDRQEVWCLSWLRRRPRGSAEARGPDRPSNMQWQTTAQAKAKDKWE